MTNKMMKKNIRCEVHVHTLPAAYNEVYEHNTQATKTTTKNNMIKNFLSDRVMFSHFLVHTMDINAQTNKITKSANKMFMYSMHTNKQANNILMNKK